MKQLDIIKRVAEGVYFTDDYGENCALCHAEASRPEEITHEDYCPTVHAKKMVQNRLNLWIEKHVKMLNLNHNLEGYTLTFLNEYYHVPQDVVKLLAERIRKETGVKIQFVDSLNTAN